MLQSDPMDMDDQQHKRDWQTHVKIMGDIYQNCILNIAAAVSDNSESGIFRKRSHGLQYRPYWRRVPSYTPSARIKNPDVDQVIILERASWASEPPTQESESTTYARGPSEVCAISITRDSDEYEILDSRGWVAQERLLSPRTIHWGNNQIYWE